MGCLIRHNLDQDNMKKVAFLCPECGKISPEIINVNVDQKYVEFKCKICAETGYFSEYFYKEDESENEHFFRYSCKPKPVEGQTEDNFLFQEYINKPEKLADTTNGSNKEIKKSELNESIEIIKKKTEQLKKIINFNKIVIEAAEKCPQNYFCLKSLENLSLYLLKEKGRDPHDLKFIFTALNYEIKISKDSIKKIQNFLNDESEKIERQVESLLLSGKNLDDDYIKCISQIKFNRLKEINLSKNEIKNIEPLCYMNLPFLEFLNLSCNHIENIKPLSELNSKKLKYLFIHYNEIKDISILIKDDFPTFDILRIDNNLIEGNSKDLIKLINIYNTKNLILITKTDEIKRYNIEYKEDTKEIEISYKDEIALKYLFINIPCNNKIEKLTLVNNEIKDPSILNRIQLDSLEELVLAKNKINNFDFLKGMKAKNLQILYLDSIGLEDLSLIEILKKKNFRNLNEINVDKSKCNPDDPKIINLKANLRNKGIKMNFIE